MRSLPPTTKRVRRASAARLNRRIEARTARRVATLAGDAGMIGARLRRLDREWDTERVLEANAATLAAGGALLGLFGHRRFMWLPLVVGGFLLQHALQGWCPPLPVIRRLGVRTAREIERERTALKALRGDFDRVPRGGPDDVRAAAALAAAD